jgi:hypothetical protein
LSITVTVTTKLSPTGSGVTGVIAEPAEPPPLPANNQRQYVENRLNYGWAGPKGDPMKHFLRFTFVGAAMLLSVILFAQENLETAKYDDAGALIFPDNLDEWIHVGSSLGGEYGSEPFDPANPGTLGIVQMEPQAYRYFKANGEYADGTMFLLSFYASNAQSSPQLPGFVQGALQGQEIHVIDSRRFAEGRGFFLYPVGSTRATASSKLPDNSPCVQCHIPEGAYNGTFSQFYPPIRERLGNVERGVAAAPDR